MITDEQLVQAMAHGDQAAFEAFVYRYHSPLLGYLERQLQDSGKAEELVQELFIRLIRQLRSDKIPPQIRPWLYHVALNLCRDYWRSGGYRTERSTSDELLEQRDAHPTVVEIYERQETRQEIIRTLQKLPEMQRDIIILRFYQDLMLQEIADVLDLSLSTVKTNLYTALKKLKKQLANGLTHELLEREEKSHV
ncbi:RNA polymerase sigma factor [Paenibacillus eucommiae]|uniref:RNA polymerase sigma-70 factor (ECF subfamily) n=1 Tax=Paenibacillus eucommiae TaxID=1355755 RepID=A0ABS4J6R7_9BACL|nr:RNA polymerase sigma factor [Paenibacillus eucommiae]MBP1994951.1 RNA polymerase sigma-70 factor (ECF subfamily) [Paenibacillus eucommiae]